MGFKVHQSAVRQFHKLGQLGPSADQISDDVFLGDDQIHGRHLHVFAVADDVVAARSAGHGDAFGGGAFLAHEVQNGLRAVAFGERQNRLHLAAICADQVIGTAFLRQLQRGVRRVDDDDLSGAHGAQHLNGDMAQATCPDDHRILPGHQVTRGLFRGTVGRQARIGIGRDLLGFEHLWQRNEVARGGDKRLGITAIAIKTGEAALAVHILAAPARNTGPVGDFRVHDDRIALFETLDLRADLLDPACVLMAQNERQKSVARGVHMRSPNALDHMQIGAAAPCPADPNDHVRALGNHRIGHVLIGQPVLGRQIVIIGV
mmetsp:Transcript_2905/g.5023  ORF Transcript_2905/g.5023 Transcript_2905/m.5023 type:complete len:318 (+) Transcript_2905:1798-2751(+)